MRCRHLTHADCMAVLLQPIHLSSQQCRFRERWPARIMLWKRKMGLEPEFRGNAATAWGSNNEQARLLTADHQLLHLGS